jgi:magnesium transporter
MSATMERHLQESVRLHARRDFTALHRDLSIEQALGEIRHRGVGEKVVYFYVVDEAGKLVGVLPTRRLLTAPPEKKLSEIMVGRVITLTEDATVLDACECFVMHKLLAFPLVDQEGRITGVVDVGMFSQEVLDLAEQERVEEVFETIGFRVSEVRDASPWRAFRYRFPWLLATILSGTACAVLAGMFELTLAKSLVLAFFLTLVLALGESVSIQTMTVTIQALRFKRPTLGWYASALWREAGTALLLGVVCGVLVLLIAWLWRGVAMPAVVIGGGIFLSLIAACFWGLSVPSLLHAFKLDPKVSAGPVALALTDICTLVFYFSLGALLL